MRQPIGPSGPEASVARVQRIFTTKLNLEPPAPDADLIESGILDSLALVELLFEIERELAIEVRVEDLDIESFRTVRRITEFVDEQTSRNENAA